MARCTADPHLLTPICAGQLAVNSSSNTRGLTPFDIPYLWTNVTDTQSFHWDYPDVHVAKALGGCGIHNAMLYGALVVIVSSVLALALTLLSACSASIAIGLRTLEHNELVLGQGAADLHGH